MQRQSLVESCWRMRGRSGYVYRCAIYRLEHGLEVRLMYGEEELVYSEVITDTTEARKLADKWRELVQKDGGFQVLESWRTSKHA